jgi:hypothetical protein
MFTGEEDHAISFDNAKVLTKAYRDNNPNQVKGGYFSKKAINSLLDQPDCVGIRIYFGNDVNKVMKIVIVGVNEGEDDLIEATNLCLDFSIPCPDRCGEDNLLNS